MVVSFRRVLSDLWAKRIEMQQDGLIDRPKTMSAPRRDISRDIIALPFAGIFRVILQEFL